VYGIGRNAEGQLGKSAAMFFKSLKAIQIGVPIEHVACGPDTSAFLSCMSGCGVAHAVGRLTVHCFGIAVAGELFVCGNNQFGQLGLGYRSPFQNNPTRVDIPGRVRSVSCGTAHMAAVTETGDLYTWGWAHGGRLGCSSGRDVLRPTLVEQVQGDIIMAGCTGSQTICIASMSESCGECA
jgi:hypothetical protein